MANKENIQRVIDAIKLAKEHKGEPGVTQFDMTKYVHSAVANYDGKHETLCNPFKCDTVACIAGFAAAVATGNVVHFTEELLRDRYVPYHNIPKVAGEFLGLEERASEELFLAEAWPRVMTAATEDDAIAVLEHLRDTGEVDWGVAGFKTYDETFGISYEDE